MIDQDTVGQAEEPGSLDALIARLGDPDPWVASRAVDDLERAHTGPDVESALIACILAYRYDPPYFSHALGGIQPFGLVEAVWSSPQVRAVDALGRSRQQGQGIEELVLRLLGDADLRAQDLGIYACGQLRLTYEPLTPTKGLVRLTGGPVITALCALLPASSPEREQRIIGLIGEAALNAPGLVAGIQDRLRGEDAKTQLQAVLEKIQLGIQGEQEFGIVRSCLRSEDENIRLGAFELFDSFQVDEQTRWAILIAAVEDPHVAIRTQSLIDFSWDGAADRPEALAALTRRLADEDDRVRILAAGALVENGVVTDVLIDTLLDSLDSECDRDVENAMATLRSLIPTRPDAFEAGIDRLLLLDGQNAGLNDLLSLTAAPADEEERGPVDTHLCVQSRGWEAAFDADETPSVLMRRLSSTDPRLRLGTARVLAESGHEAAPEVEALLERCLGVSMVRGAGNRGTGAPVPPTGRGRLRTPARAPRRREPACPTRGDGNLQPPCGAAHPPGRGSVWGCDPAGAARAHGPRAAIIDGRSCALGAGRSETGNGKPVRSLACLTPDAVKAATLLGQGHEVAGAVELWSV